MPPARADREAFFPGSGVPLVRMSPGAPPCDWVARSDSMQERQAVGKRHHCQAALGWHGLTRPRRGRPWARPTTAKMGETVALVRETVGLFGSVFFVKPHSWTCQGRFLALLGHFFCARRAVLPLWKKGHRHVVGSGVHCHRMPGARSPAPSFPRLSKMGSIGFVSLRETAFAIAPGGKNGFVSQTFFVHRLPSFRDWSHLVGIVAGSCDPRSVEHQSLALLARIEMIGAHFMPWI